MPCILTCALGKTLSFSPAEDHWEIRSRAAIVLAELIRQYANRGNWGTRYGVTYPKLQNQVLITLNRVLHTPNSTIPSVFGVLVCSWKRGNSRIGVSRMGDAMIRRMLLPIARELNANLEAILAKRKSITAEVQAYRCIFALTVGETWKLECRRRWGSWERACRDGWKWVSSARK